MARPLIGDELDHALPPGTMLGDCVIAEVVGTGGFSVVYAATDNLGRRLAIKEYMPESLARRVAGATVAPRSERTAATFQQGLESFVKEAKTLARFRNPAILPVYSFWEANGTAYMAMPLFSGRTLKDELKARAEPPDEAWLRALLGSLLDVLEILHAERVWHRDIAPDNIMLQDGQPMLLDFGAARRVIGEGTQTLTAILKPGYAPWEQYGEAPGLQQGPWTDLYALAAVMYRAISGKVPVASVARIATDTLTPIAEIGRGRYSASFLKAIDQALAVRTNDRPQSVAEFRRLLDVPDDDESTRVLPATAPAKVVVPRPASTAQSASAPTPAPPAEPGRRRFGKVIVAVGVAAMAAIGLARFVATRDAAVPRAEATAPAPAASAVLVAPPAPVTATAPELAATPPPTAKVETSAPAPVVEAPVAARPSDAPVDDAKPLVSSVAPAPAPTARTPAAVALRAEPRPKLKTTTGTGPDPICRDLLAQASLGQDSPSLREQLASHKCY